MLMFKKTLELPSAAEALPGRATPIPTAAEHFIFRRPLKEPYPAGLETAMFGMWLLLGRRAQILGIG
jgi:peptide-methionine (S)-S-oxide reductase